MLIKRSEARAGKQRLAAAYAGLSSGGLDRRAFLKQAGVTGVGLSALGAIPLTTVRPAVAGPVNHAEPVTRVKNICTHCSVGCTVTAEVQNGVWVGQEPCLGQPDQPRHALRQGCLGARARARPAAHQVSDEAGERPVAAHVVGRRPDRDRRQADGGAPGFRPRQRVLAGQREILE